MRAILAGSWRRCVAGFWRSDPDDELLEVRLLRQIHQIGEQQKHINDMRERLVDMCAYLKHDELFAELDRLAALGAEVEGEAPPPCEVDDDRLVMFV